MSRALVAVVGIAGVAALLAPAVVSPAPALLWNVTASAPVGLYLVRRDRTFAVGDWVAARAPASLAALFAQRRYVPLGVPLVKRIAAIAPQRVCRSGLQVSVDQRPIAQAHGVDRMGRPLPAWRGCRRLEDGELFLLNGAKDSLDGRYFGPSPVHDIVGRLTPLWIVREAAR